MKAELVTQHIDGACIGSAITSYLNLIAVNDPFQRAIPAWQSSIIGEWVERRGAAILPFEE